MTAVPEGWDAFPEVWLDPFEVDQKLLKDFGVTAAPFQNALDLARLEWAACTANDPPCLPGTIFWGAAVRYLRSELLSLGWTKDDSRNFSVVISPDGSKAIAVATGDDYTGTQQVSIFPRTKSAKGPATVDAVAVNQLDLFGMVDPARPPMTTPGTIRTYWFLVRVADGEAFGEILLPLIMDEDRRIGRCKERIVLPSRASGEDGPTGVRRRGPEVGPDVEVQITRRAG